MYRDLPAIPLLVVGIWREKPWRDKWWDKSLIHAMTY